MQTDEILTGEGVLLDIRPTSFAVRMLAWMIDFFMFTTVFGFVSSAVSILTVGLDDAAFQAVLLLTYVLLIVGVPTTVETLTRGRSLGKMALGIRIVRDDGGPIRFRHAFIRAMLAVIELWATLGGLAILVSLTNDRGKRLGDILAGTYATRVRGAERAYRPVFMPPELAPWAAIAEIRRLPDGVALAARQYLGRASNFTEQARVARGLELAAQVEQYVSPPPPLGTSPDRFLAAVLATRRSREFAIGRQQQMRIAEMDHSMARLPFGIPDIEAGPYTEVPAEQMSGPPTPPRPPAVSQYR